MSEKIEFILKVISRRGSLRFAGCSPAPPAAPEVICTFLALLELIRLRQIVCSQPESFRRIENPLVAPTAAGAPASGNGAGFSSSPAAEPVAAPAPEPIISQQLLLQRGWARKGKPRVNRNRNRNLKWNLNSFWNSLLFSAQNFEREGNSRRARAAADRRAPIPRQIAGQTRDPELTLRAEELAPRTRIRRSQLSPRDASRVPGNLSAPEFGRVGALRGREDIVPPRLSRPRSKAGIIVSPAISAPRLSRFAA